MKILEARLLTNLAAIEPAECTLDEWTDTGFDDVRDWEDAARGNVGALLELCPYDERPATIWGAAPDMRIYRWPSSALGIGNDWEYTAVREVAP